MTPTLLGRIQTRLALLLVVGLGWTLLVTPFLPAGGAPIGERYGATLSALVLVGLFGVVLWEPLYHGLQQLRWEKDWPTGLGLVTAVPEGILTYVVLGSLRNVSGAAFFLQQRCTQRQAAPGDATCALHLARHPLNQRLIALCHLALNSEDFSIFLVPIS